MRETTSGSRFSLIPEGTYRFNVISVSDKFASGKSHYRDWGISYIDSMGELKRDRIRLYPWEAVESGLLVAVGGIEQKDGSVDWDDDDVAGKSFVGEIYHETYNDKIYHKLRNCKPIKKDEEVPF